MEFSGSSVLICLWQQGTWKTAKVSCRWIWAKLTLSKRGLRLIKPCDKIISVMFCVMRQPVALISIKMHCASKYSMHLFCYMGNWKCLSAHSTWPMYLCFWVVTKVCFSASIVPLVLPGSQWYIYITVHGLSSSSRGIRFSFLRNNMVRSLASAVMTWWFYDFCWCWLGPSAKLFFPFNFWHGGMEWLPPGYLPLFPQQRCKLFQ